MLDIWSAMRQPLSIHSGMNIYALARPRAYIVNFSLRTSIFTTCINVFFASISIRVESSDANKKCLSPGRESEFITQEIYETRTTLHIRIDGLV